MSAPEIIYFPIAGRGELPRLTAAAGGLDFTDTIAGTTSEFFGALPILVHNDVSLCQSQAIVSYLSNIAPKFSGLTAAQKGVDDMYAGIFEDVLSGCSKGERHHPFLSVCACHPHYRRCASSVRGPLHGTGDYPSTPGQVLHSRRGYGPFLWLC